MLTNLKIYSHRLFSILFLSFCISACHQNASKTTTKFIAGQSGITGKETPIGITSAYQKNTLKELASNTSKSPKSNAFFPAPTEIRSNETEDEEEEQTARIKWIENMHRCAPDINWKQLDETFRYQRHTATRQAMFKTEMIDSGKLKGTWVEKGSKNQAGRIELSDIDTITGDIYTASGGGNVFRYNGTSWQSLNESFKFNGISMLRILQKKSGHRILVGASNNNFYYSDDEGLTWNKSNGLSNAERWGNCAKGIMTNDSNHSIFLLLQEWDYNKWNSIVSIYHSKDSGVNFTRILSYPDLNFYGTGRYDIWTSYYGTGKTYLLKDSNIYFIASADTITQKQGKIPLKSTGNEYLTGTEIGGKTYLYAMVDTFIYNSADGGKTWKYKYYFGNTPYTKWSFNCSNSNANYLSIGSVDCWFSKNGGLAFNAVNQWWDYYPSPSNKLHADIHSILSFKNKGIEYLMVANDGGLYHCSNSYSSISNLGLNGLNVSMYYTTLTDQNNLNICYAGSQDQGFQKALYDSGSTMLFDQVISGDYGHIVSADSGKSLWTVYPTFADYYPHAESSKSQYSWSYNFNSSKGPALWMAPLLAEPNQANIAWLGGGGMDSGAHLVKLVYDSVSNKVSATEQKFDFSKNKLGQISAIACSNINTKYRYLLTENGGYYYSTDGGKTWNLNTKFTAPSGHYFYGSCVLPSHKKLGKLWICGSGYSNPAVYVSEDNGATFTAITTGFPSTLCYQLVSDTAENFIYAATELGPYVLNTKEGVWYYLGGSSAPDQTYWSVEFIASTNTVRYGTYGRGIWDFKINNNTINGIANLNAGNQNISLEIYPNPCAEQLNFKFQNPEQSKICISIFNAAGILMYQKNLTEEKGIISETINVEKFAKGNYTLQIWSNVFYNSKNFIKL